MVISECKLHFMGLGHKIRALSYKNIQVGNDQKISQTENSHFINRGVGKTELTLRYLYQVSKW